MSDIATELYRMGSEAYWGGQVPEGWDAKDASENPYLAGWNHAADMEHQQNWFTACHHEFDYCLDDAGFGVCDDNTEDEN